MRVVNEKFETITEYDLTAGKLIPKVAVKENAKPIDNVKKFAWADEDWEEVQMFVPNPMRPEPAPQNPETTSTADMAAAILEGVNDV